MTNKSTNDLGAILTADQVMAEIAEYASEPVKKVLLDSYAGKYGKESAGKIAAVAVRDLALEPVMMFRRKTPRDQTPAHLRSLEAGKR